MWSPTYLLAFIRKPQLCLFFYLGFRQITPTLHVPLIRRWWGKRKRWVMVSDKLKSPSILIQISEYFTRVDISSFDKDISMSCNVITECCYCSLIVLASHDDDSILVGRREIAQLNQPEIRIEKSFFILRYRNKVALEEERLRVSTWGRLITLANNNNHQQEEQLNPLFFDV